MTGVPPSCRLEVVFASASRRAVILRRGPHDHVRLIAWDRADDSFEPGQWLLGKRVYAERCDLSPDGAYLVSFIATFRAPLRTYTVLSRPPFFTALALWPWITTYGGGGTFIGHRAMELHQPDGLMDGFALPEGFEVTSTCSAPTTGQWRLHSVERRFAVWRGFERDRQAKAGAGFTLVADPPEPFGTAPRYAILAAGGEVLLPGVQWADFDEGGDLLFSIQGALYRCPAGTAVTSIAELIASSRRLADFGAMRFERVLAPYGGAGPDGSWAPPLDRVAVEDRRRRVSARKASATPERFDAGRRGKR